MMHSKFQYLFYKLRFLPLLTGLCLVVLGLTGAYPASATTAREYQIKAAFLYNFVNFITWPEASFSSPEEPYTLCVLGEDPFGVLLDITTENVTAKNRSLAVVRFAQIEDLEHHRCHILFISHSEQEHLDALIETLHQQAILTVTEMEHAVHDGVMIEFYTVRKKIRLKINREELENTGLKADGNLLNLANICDSKGCKR